MFTRITVTSQLVGTVVQVLLGVPDAFRKWGRCWPVQDSDTRTRPFRDLNAVKPRILIQPAWADGPNLAGRQWIGADAVFALQLRCNDELLHTILAQRIAEMGVPEFC